MGNRALRRQVGKALKDAGYSKKLFRGSKKCPKKYLDAAYLRHTLYMLSFKVGDVVHDCDGFNHQVKGHHRYYLRWVRNVSFLCLDQLIFEDGKFSCGCPSGPNLSVPREEIEKYLLLTDAQVEEQRKSGWWSEYSQKIQDTLKNGEHVCDEHGIIFPEFTKTF